MTRYHWFYGVASTCAILGFVACWSLPDIVAPQPGDGGSTVDGNGTTASPTPGSPTPVVSVTPSPIPRTTYLHQEGGVIKDATGSNVQLHGIAWYGFDYQDKLDGPASASRLGSDVVTVMQRMRLLGFNAVYFPFSFSQLYNLSTGLQLTTTSSSSMQCSGDSTLADILQSVSVSGLKNPNSNVPLLTNVPQLTPGYCNDYLPDAGQLVVARLAAVISIFTRNGFYVMLSENVKASASDSALSLDASQFSRWWKILVSDLVTQGAMYEGIPSAVCNSDPNNSPLALCHNLIVHMAENSAGLNPNLTWEPNQQDNRPTGAHQLYVQAFQALNTVMPRVMITIEGGYQFGFSTPYNMGVNTDTGSNFPQLARDPTIASGVNFFNDVFNGAIDESRMILGFPAFGPTTDHWLQQFVNPPPGTSPGSISAKIANDLDTSFGRASTSGIKDASQNSHVFPSFPIPLSGNLDDPNDMAFLSAMHGYMQGHNMNHFVWYCWDGGSSTYSGLVDAQTFKTVDHDTLNYLQLMGLTPP